MTIFKLLWRRLNSSMDPNYVREYQVRSAGVRYLIQEIPLEDFKLYWSN